MRKPPSKLHAVAYILVGFLLFIGIAAWVFFSFFFEDLLNTFAVPKIEEAALTATHGVYHLKLGRISYNHHKILCAGFDLQRVRYDSGAQGTAVKRVYIDTVEFTGVNLWRMFWSKTLAMTSIQMDSPRVYMTDLSKEKPSLRDPAADSLRIVKSAPINIPIISFDSIALRNISLYLPDRLNPGDEPSFKGISFRLTDFYFNSKTKEAQPVLFSKRVDLAIPDAKYPAGDGTNSLEVKNLRGNSVDSLITVDKIAFEPNFSESAFAEKYKYAKSRLNFRCNGIRIEGINFVSSFSNGNIVFRKFTTNTWFLDTYEDRTRPADPHPPRAMMPNELISDLPIKIDIDSIIFKDGEIRVRERKAGSPGTLGFTHAHLTISPISKDTLSPRYKKPAVIMASAYFLGQALLKTTATYPLHEKNFDMNLKATLGAFSVEKLNSFLIPNERIEITGGEVQSAGINMAIHSGVSTTTVTPLYSGFKIKVLPKDPNAKPGLMEKLKTFIAKTFVLDSSNPDDNKLLPGTTSLVRTPNMEFMQFIWLSLRKSLGKVVGGFK